MYLQSQETIRSTRPKPGEPETGSEAGTHSAGTESRGRAARPPRKQTQPWGEAAEISTHSACGSQAQKLQLGFADVCIPAWARPPLFHSRATESDWAFPECVTQAAPRPPPG